MLLSSESLQRAGARLLSKGWGKGERSPASRAGEVPGPLPDRVFGLQRKERGAMQEAEQDKGDSEPHAVWREEVPERAGELG